MKIITNIISFLAMFFLVGEAFTVRYENTGVLSGTRSVAPLTNILSVPPNNDISDKDIQQHFPYADGILADIGYLAVRTFDICGVMENIRLSVLLDYECRAP
jgi:hypothetical protein